MNDFKLFLSNAAKAILPIVGILIIVFMAVLMYYWETIGREKFLYKPVIVFTIDIPAGTIINDENILKTQWVEFDKVIENAITDKNQVIGKAAAHFIPKDTQLHPSYLEDKELVLNPGQYIYKIPNDWLFSVPESLRRKDHIAVYEVNTSIAQRITQNNNSQASSTVETTTNEPKIILKGDASKTSNQTSITTYNESQLSNIQSVTGNILFETIVSYVKDTNNREVVTVGMNDRYDGSSKINDIEVVGTLDQINKLKESAEAGNRFIILYSSGGGN